MVIVLVSKQRQVFTCLRGSWVLSRIANYYPDRFLALAWLTIAYSSPSDRFSVDAINAYSEEKLGYPVFGYWEFFNDPETAELLDHNVSPSSLLSRPQIQSFIGLNISFPMLRSSPSWPFYSPRTRSKSKLHSAPTAPRAPGSRPAKAALSLPSLAPQNLKTMSASSPRATGVRSVLHSSKRFLLSTLPLFTTLTDLTQLVQSNASQRQRRR